MKISSKLFKRLIAFISLLASLIGIYVFVSGNSSLSQYLSDEGENSITASVEKSNKSEKSEINSRNKKYVTFANKEFFGLKRGTKIFLHDGEKKKTVFKSNEIEIAYVGLSPDNKRICFIKSEQHEYPFWRKNNDLNILSIDNMTMVSYTPNKTHMISNAVWIDNSTITINIEQNEFCKSGGGYLGESRKQELKSCKTKKFAGYSFQKFGNQRIKIDEQNVITAIVSF